MNRWAIITGIAALAAALLLGGCARPAAPVAPTMPDPNTDPTALRLQDLAGDVLFFFARHRRLPSSLVELGASIPGGDPSLVTDPASRLPFVYQVHGPVIAHFPGRLLMYQPVAGPGPGRWVLLLDDSGRTGRLGTFVQYVPETLLQAALTPATKPN